MKIINNIIRKKGKDKGIIKEGRRREKKEIRIKGVKLRKG